MKRTLPDKLEELCRARLGADYGEIVLEKVKLYLINGKLVKIEVIEDNKRVMLQDE